MQQGMDEDLYQAVSRYYEVDEFSEREKLVIEYGERFAIDHMTIDDEFNDRMKQHFSDAEILEIAVAAGFFVGMGRVNTVLDIAHDFDTLYVAEPE